MAAIKHRCLIFADIRKPVGPESQHLVSLDAMHEPGINGTIDEYKPVHWKRWNIPSFHQLIMESFNGFDKQGYRDLQKNRSKTD